MVFEGMKMWERVLEKVGAGIFVFTGGPTIFLSYLHIILPFQPLFTAIISISSLKILLMQGGI
jgi:phosphoserine phosphatase